ncbi:GntR family transcriptional regulator [Streptomyces pluripotens]|uniref:GntR family transcriptional regulator n=1 Tax=Streptomyces pluripotens TaxID=1355015 RepID=A0A221P8P1_9ACTN|nr:GntR family transcriptional regulator [Streptomyces pluripotens]ARP74213.1 GntR family transcriptional regulator [Streptomyces pluripotens]ASN28484.1 GntR family transcriptional regulator [Streptomyces pluripotens]
MTSRRLIVADDLRRQITTGCFGPGDRLPSESTLADRYKVSTATLRSALAALQGEGLVEKIHGKGNFVRRPLRKVTYVGGWGTLDPRTAADVNLRVTVRTTATQARGHLTTLLRVADGSPLTELLHLSYEGDSPHSLARIYVPRDPRSATVPGVRSSRAWAEASFSVPNPPPAEVRETVSARLPTPDEVSTLRINKTLAVLAITRVATDSAGRVLQAALIVFPGERVDAVFTTHHETDERQAYR